MFGSGSGAFGSVGSVARSVRSVFGALGVVDSLVNYWPSAAEAGREATCEPKKRARGPKKETRAPKKALARQHTEKGGSAREIRAKPFFGAPAPLLARV